MLTRAFDNLTKQLMRWNDFASIIHDYRRTIYKTYKTYRLLILMLVALASAPSTALAQPSSSADQQLRLILSLYNLGEYYRAQTEIMRFMYFFPESFDRDLVGYLNATIFYTQKEFNQSNAQLFAISQLASSTEMSQRINRLLTFNFIEMNDFGLAQKYWEQSQPWSVPPVIDLSTPSPDAVSPDAAMAMSIFLPGSGYFLSGEVTKGLTSMALQAGFITAAAFSFKEGLNAWGAFMVIIELFLYNGARQGSYEAAILYNRNLERQRKDDLLNKWDPLEGLPVVLPGAQP